MDFIDAWRSGLFGCAVVLGLVFSECTPAVAPSPLPPLPEDGGPGTPCEQACLEMTILCGPQRANCVATMQHIDESAKVSEPSGKPLNCEDVLSAHSSAEMAALGVPCN